MIFTMSTNVINPYKPKICRAGPYADYQRPGDHVALQWRHHCDAIYPTMHLKAQSVDWCLLWRSVCTKSFRHRMDELRSPLQTGAVSAPISVSTLRCCCRCWHRNALCGDHRQVYSAISFYRPPPRTTIKACRVMWWPLIFENRRL